MIAIILFLVVIGVLVFVHEGGHFLAAKMLGISVEEFALGFGPKLIGKEWKGTLYRINLLPLGGYVKVFGEGDYDNADPHSFEAQTTWKKLVVILAGVCMNVLLAACIYTGFMIHYNFVQYIPQVIPNTFPFGQVTGAVSFEVDSTDKTSPLKPYDLNSIYILTSINGEKVGTEQSVESSLVPLAGKKVKLSFTDDTGLHPQTIVIVPRLHPPKGKGAIGIFLSPLAKISFTGIQKPVSGVLYAADMLQYNVSALGTVISEAIKTHTAAPVTSNLTGPVGIYEVTGSVYQESGIMGVINIIALLSLALALMNVLPFPVLDGGLACIIIIEAIIRKPLNANVKAWIGNIGVIILVLLMVFITINDINNFNIIGQIKHLFGR